MADVWFNGAYIEEEAAGVTLRDAGLLHAAGVFTTMRAYDGRIYRLMDHLKRLRASCDALFIPLTFQDEELVEIANELLRRNQLAEARMRFTVTRGEIQQDPVHGVRIDPTVFLTATQTEPYPAEFYEKGITVVVVDEQKLNPYDFQAGHKTLNYMSRLAALRQANQNNAVEALWFNVHNYLQSGSISNVFLVKNGVLITPPTPEDLQDVQLRDAMPYKRSAVLPGVTRGRVLALAEEMGIETRLAAIDIAMLLEADEVFITNSMMNVLPVCRVERRAIGNDKPGAITQRLGDAIRADIKGK